MQMIKSLTKRLSVRLFVLRNDLRCSLFIMSFYDKVEKYERSLIVEMLKQTSGNVSEAAIQLEMSRRNLIYKIKKYDVKISTEKITTQNIFISIT